jgi:hypothetical protein
MPPDFDPLIEVGADVDETFPTLEGEAGEQIRRSILLHGIGCARMVCLLPRCQSPMGWDGCLTTLAEEYGRNSTKGAANPLLWERGLGFDWAGQFPRRPRIDWRYCPIHLVDNGARLGIPPGFLSFFGRIAAFVESGRFLKRLRICRIRSSGLGNGRSRDLRWQLREVQISNRGPTVAPEFILCG